MFVHVNVPLQQHNVLERDKVGQPQGYLQYYLVVCMAGMGHRNKCQNGGCDNSSNRQQFRHRKMFSPFYFIFYFYFYFFEFFVYKSRRGGKQCAALQQGRVHYVREGGVIRQGKKEKKENKFEGIVSLGLILFSR